MSTVEEFLEHHGVKGQKWGVRRKAKRFQRQQENVDIYRRVASGKGSKPDKLVVNLESSAYRLIKGGGTVGAAKLRLDAQQKQQAKVLAGKAKAIDILAKAYGIRIRDLDYSYG